MKRARRIRFGCTLILNAALIAAIYEVQSAIDTQSIPWRLLAVGLSVPVAFYTSRAAISLVYKVRFVRRAILREQWLEGVWIVDTYQSEEHVAAGIAEVRHAGPSLTPIINTYHPDGIRDTGVTYGVSRHVFVEEHSLFYLNYFEVRGDERALAGVAVGHCHRGASDSATCSYAGKIFFSDGSEPAFQEAIRLTDDEVREVQVEHGQRWKLALVEEYGQRLTMTNHRRIGTSGD